MVTTRPQRYRDEFQAHYTAATPIVPFMVSRLQQGEEDLIWEPCAGAGDLIDCVLAHTPRATVRASELNAKAVSLLSEKYRDRTVKVYEEDALDVGVPSLFEPFQQFTRVIANPPYGAYQSPERRKRLQSRYPNIYVRETYGVILIHALSLLKENGRLVFIVPDTFLWLHRHKGLREILLRDAKIEELALFPSKFFPKVNFGYSGLCIITARKDRSTTEQRVRIVTGFSNADELLACIGKDESDWPCAITYVSQNAIADRPFLELVYRNEGDGVAMSARATGTIGAFAEFKTGFYSGNDRHWIRKASDEIPRSKAFPRIAPSEIAQGCATLDGFQGEAAFIPIVRGGATPFVKRTSWYVNWHVDAIREYRRNGKNPARFQNSSFYFREGIGVPMVASGRLTAALLENRLFDQSIVGVFPKDSRYLLFLLGFFNTTIATELVRQINPTANNSANYLKRLPFVTPTLHELEAANQLVAQAISQANESGSVGEEQMRKIDNFYRELFQNS
ncbi:MAG: class I SAM-dependent methyltransferase [Planctomycetaceae bacterium]